MLQKGWIWLDADVYADCVELAGANCFFLYKRKGIWGCVLSKARCNKGWRWKKRGHVCSGGRADVCMMHLCCNYEKGREARLHQGLLHVRIIYIMLNDFEEWLKQAVFGFRGGGGGRSPDPILFRPFSGPAGSARRLQTRGVFRWPRPPPNWVQAPINPAQNFF